MKRHFYPWEMHPESTVAEKLDRLKADADNSVEFVTWAIKSEDFYVWFPMHPVGSRMDIRIFRAVW